MKKLPSLVCLILFLTTAGVWAAQAPFKPPQQYMLHYGIYGGGFQALDATIGINVTSRSYKIQMRAKPYGMWGYLLPWAGDHYSEGANSKGKMIPELHERTSTWRGKVSHVAARYKNGVLTSMKTRDAAELPEKNTPLDPAFTKGTVDTLTAILQLIVDTTNKDRCNFSKDVYDGKRRFALRFTDEGVQDLPQSSLNVYQGPARKCKIELVPEKGFDQNAKGYYKIQETARAKGALPRVWLARLTTTGPMVPVRVRIDTDYGVVFVHLSNVKH